jgi:hypothetical protein
MKRQAISVLSLFVFAGCKPSVSEGRLASLDNFAGTGNKKINICSGNARTSTVPPWSKEVCDHRSFEFK